MFDGKKIRVKRHELSLSAEELAQQLGVGVESVYKWEKGTTPRDKNTIDKINNWLNGEVVKSNGTAKYYEEKYIALLERTNANYEAIIKKLTE